MTGLHLRGCQWRPVLPGPELSADLLVFVLFSPGEFVDENIRQEDLTEQRGQEVTSGQGQQEQSEGDVLPGRRKYSVVVQINET